MYKYSKITYFLSFLLTTLICTANQGQKRQANCSTGILNFLQDSSRTIFSIPHQKALNDIYILNNSTYPLSNNLGNVFNKKFYEHSRINFEYINSASSFDKASNGIQIIGSLQLNSILNLGIGFGTKFHHDRSAYNLNTHFSYPLFTRISMDIWSNKSTPYVFTDIGSLLEMNKTENLFRPPLIRLGLGNKLLVNKSEIYLSLNYAYSKTRTKYEFKPGSTAYSNWFNGHAIEVILGIQL